MARPDSWMPMYWRDFWADTAHLNEQEGWAYLNLIGAYWTGGKPLPNDNGRLQRMSRCSPEVWAAVSATVTAFFHCDSDCLSHPRIDKELAKATRTFTARSHWMQSLNDKRKKPQSLDTDTVPVTDTVTARQPQPHSTNVEKTPIAPKGAIAYTQEFLTFWESYPNKVGKDAAWRAWTKRKDRPSLEIILASLQAYIRTKPDDRAWCNPATWINQGRWSDAPADAPPVIASLNDGERARWVVRCVGFVKSTTNFWNRDQWGPAPNEAGTKVPGDVLNETGADLVVPAFLRRRDVTMAG